MKIGSLFSGYGGLDCGVQLALGGTVAWHCDNDPGASKILAHHWPDVPNLGDITQVDWTQVEPVDVITGGFPCQDVSHAGKRLGLRPGTRTGLWSHMAYAIGVLRPAMVIAENVRGLLSARAYGDLEPCPWCLGDERDDALRALGAVLGDLAGLGYDARWVGLRAADVGAPHGRFRVFVVATDANRSGSQARSGRPGGGDVRRLEPVVCVGATTPDADQFGHERTGSARGRRSGPTDDGGAAADAGRQRHGRGEDGRSLGRLDGDDESEARQRERAWAVAGDRGAQAAADAADGGQQELTSRTDGVKLDSAWTDGEGVGEWVGARAGARGDAGRETAGTATAWGQYEPAIRRWERLTRPAPPPTEPGSKGQPRLSPRFVEWLMGLPAGHVTDVPGLSRNDQLKALGNGVVPQQAAAALAILLDQRAAA